MADKRTYELVLIFDPNLEAEQLESELRRYQDVIAANGETRRWERWGKRRMAYEIRGKQYGLYALAVFDLTRASVAELERLVRLNTLIMRHLLTIVDPARAPEVDAEAVRTLGATAVVSAPADTEATTPEAEAVVTPVAEVSEDTEEAEVSAQE